MTMISKEEDEKGIFLKKQKYSKIGNERENFKARDETTCCVEI